MTHQIDVDDFLAQSKLAVVGVSRNTKKMGYVIFKDLQKKGYEVFPVNANASEIDGEPCYPDLKSLPEKVGGIVLVVPPHISEKVVIEASEVGITRVWMQSGSWSEKAVEFCKANHITVIYGECVMMFAPPVTSIHSFHRWLRKIFGKLPK